MTLLASSCTLPQLYLPTPKVLLWGMSATEYRKACAALPGYLCLPVAQTTKGDFILGDARKGADEEVALPPANVHCLWSKKRQAVWESLLQWWRQHGGEDALPRVVAGDSIALQNELLTIALQENAVLLREKLEANQMLTALRLQHEELRSLHGSLQERFVGSYRDYMEMSFITKPRDNESIALPTGSAAALVQNVPGDGCGLSCIDVFIDRVGAQEGTMVAELCCGERNEPLAHWHVPLETIKPGWRQFYLSQALERHYPDMSIRLYAVYPNAAPQSPPALRLAPILHSRFCLPAHAQRMIACRLWQGTPGIGYRHGFAQNAPAAEGQEGASRAIRLKLAESMLAQFNDVNPMESSFPYFRVHSGGRVFLHPLETGVTSARLDGALFPDAVGVSALASIRSTKCQVPVDVRMVVGMTGASATEVLSGEKVFADSGWVTVEQNMHRYQVNAPFPDAPVPENAPWFLFSKPNNEKAPHFAWLEFSDFSVDISA